MNSQSVTNCGLRVNHAALVECLSDWSWDSSEALWEDFDLWTVLDGEGMLAVGSETYRLSRGMCFLLTSQDSFTATHDPSNPLSVIYVHFDVVDEQNQAITRAPLPTLDRKIADMTFFQGLLERVLISCRDGSGEQHFWLRAALAECQRQEKLHNHQDKSELELRHRVLLNEIQNEIRARPSVTLDEIVCKANYTKEHVIRIFKQYLGCTPYQFILDTRMEEAQKLLLSTNYSGEYISRVLGYSDPYYFSRQFRKRVGVSPTAFRRSRTTAMESTE